MLDYFSTAIKNITRKKLKSILIIIGVSIGVLSVVIISTIGEMGKNIINNELNSVGMDSISIYSSMKKQNIQIEKDDIDIIKSYDNIKDITALTANFSSAIIKDYLFNSFLWGVDNNISNIIDINVLHGRMINKYDVESNRKVCVIDENFAKKTYNRTNIIGKKIDILVDNTYTEFEIIGVTSSIGNMIQGIVTEYIPHFIYIPFSTYQTLSGNKYFDQIMLNLKDTTTSNETIDAITTSIEKRKGYIGSIQSKNLVDEKNNFNYIIDMITFVLSIIAGISIIVSGLSIMTIMLVSIKDRTKEIGIKKAIGAKNSSIIIEFLLESSILSAIGGIIGISLGIFIMFIGSLIISIKLILNIPYILFLFIFTSFIGIIFGVYPALKASKLHPIVALRNE
ncbi:MAG: ABC transporter permease [Oscillospiraceae bacterium]|nr:ABC transporter permease [Oscillospiraceae bacterium]